MANEQYLKNLKAGLKAVEALVAEAKEVNVSPDKSRELALAITNLEQGMMWLEKHIASSK